MFVLLVNYKVPLERVIELLPAHNAYLDKNYAAGHFIASGPRVPRDGGLIMCQAESRAEVERIIEEDPFNEIADIQIVEFTPNKRAEGFVFS